MKISEQRYLRNQPIITSDKQRKISNVKVAIVGLGGLGGYVAELCTRLGIGELVLIDQDVFEATNLNRQLFANETNLGQPKVYETKKYLKKINSEININSHLVKLNNREDIKYLNNAEYIFDCLDNIEGRLLLQEFSIQLKIPLIHGSISQWEGQTGFFLPNKRYMDLIYSHGANTKVEPGANLPTIPAFIASMQVNLLMAYLIDKNNIQPNILHRFNFLTYELFSIDLN